MAITAINTIKNWFKTGLIPTQEQFWAWLDSYRHKSEKIPVADIEGIDDLIAGKASTATLSAFIASKGAANGLVPLSSALKILSQYLPIIDDLTSGGAGSIASAETVKQLKILFDSVIVDSVSLGAITPEDVDDLPLTGKLHGFTTKAGIYTKWGSLEVPANSLAVLSRDDVGGFSMSVGELDLGLEDYTKKSDLNNFNGGLKNYDSLVKPTDPAQLNPKSWSFVSGGGVSTDGKITIKTNAVQSKINVPNPTNVGQDYLIFIYLHDIEKLHANVTGLGVYNYDQRLIDIPVNVSGFYYVKFTSTFSSAIQLFVDGDVNSLPEGTDLIAFKSTFFTVCEWSEELENILSNVKNNYKDGTISIIQSLFELGKDDFEFSYEYNLPENSFNTFSTTANKITGLSGGFANFDGSANTIGDVTKEVVDGILHYNATMDFGAEYTFARLGIDFDPSLYATVAKNYVVIIKGQVTGNNAQNLSYKSANGTVACMMNQDLTNGVAASFKVAVPIHYSAGQSDGDRYTWIDATRKSTGVSTVTVDYLISVFAVFEAIEGFTIDDYLNVVNGDIVVPVYAPIGTATESFVNAKISAINTSSKYNAQTLKLGYDIEMIGSGGQSLNVGAGAASSANDFKNTLTFTGGSNLATVPFSSGGEKAAYYGSGFINLDDSTVDNYPPVTAALTSVLSLIENENKVDVEEFNYQMIPLTWGLSGAAIVSMEKGTTPYNDMIECVVKSKEYANKLGKTFAVRWMLWYQGEGDNDQTKTYYYNKLTALYSDLNSDIKAITGQSQEVQFITYQTSPWLGVDMGFATHPDMAIQEAQVQAAKDYNDIHLCGAMYQFAYADIFHPEDRAIVGLQSGIAAKRIVHDGEVWKTFQPISHQVITDGTKYYTHLKFDVPVKPARFDISGDAYHNPNGKQTNFGFQVLGSGVEKQIAEPFITRGDTVVLTTTENPVGMNIRYAVNGHYGGGNLCDSQNITVRNKNIDYVIDNFCVGFSEYIID